MSLELDPSELGFKRPFNVEVSQTLRLRNTNRDPVAFKVKTTAPKHYCVRPNSGKIEPGQSVEVSVVLQPMKQDPPAETRCKDKFLVQSVVIPANREFESWTQIEQSSKASIVERKIRVHYLPASGSSPHANGHDGNHDDSTMLGSPPQTYTPRANGTDDMSKSDSKSLESGTYVDQHELPSDPSSIAPAASTSRDDLASQLAEANATIARLRKESEQGLRRRKEDTSSSKGLSSGVMDMGVPTAQPAAGGVAVRTTALLCLFTFLLTYLLF